MSNFLTDIGLLAGQNQFLAYFIIYLITIFLGNISGFAGLWLAFRGFFGPWGVPLVLLTLFLSDISGDFLWYSLGRSLRDTRLGNFVKNRLPRHQKIEAGLQKNGRGWIFISKFLYASTFPIIFFVGWFRFEFRKFFKTSLLSIVCWLPVLTGLAYGLISGLTPLRAIAIFKRFELLFLVGLALFIVADYFLARLLKKFFNSGLE